MLNVPEIFDSVHLSTLDSLDYNYQLWRIHPDTGEKQIILGASDGEMEAPKYSTKSGNEENIIYLIVSDKNLSVINISKRNLFVMIRDRMVSSGEYMTEEQNYTFSLIP